jgi:hypothetical protein
LLWKKNITINEKVMAFGPILDFGRLLERDSLNLTISFAILYTSRASYTFLFFFATNECYKNEKFLTNFVNPVRYLNSGCYKKKNLVGYILYLSSGQKYFGKFVGCVKKWVG